MSCSAAWDHPRVCGEKGADVGEKIDLMGSPPRVRGKAVDTVGEDRPQGITPACAGKSMLNRSAAVRFWDHPRVCGEKVRRAALLFSSLGSPPRVRGKDGFSVKLDNAQGITPACAGKSTFTATCPESGSPPRVRGKALEYAPVLFAAGITPACAGKRRRRFPLPSRTEDHPRVCGEKKLSSSAAIYLE